MLYRTAGLIDGMLAADGHAPRRRLAALEEFAIEASILKVAGSEMLDYVLDENVQIHGGNGFVRDYPAERHYRDARVNRIFEGTNEINRLLIPGMLARRARQGRPAADRRRAQAAGRAADAVAAGDAPATARWTAERRAVAAMKKVGADGARHRDADLRRQAGRRAGSPDDRRRHRHRRLRGRERRRCARPQARQRPAPQRRGRASFVNDAAGRVEIAARTALAAMADGDTLRTLLAALRRC